MFPWHFLHPDNSSPTQNRHWHDGHRRLLLLLEAWRSHHSPSPKWSRWRHTISDAKCARLVAWHSGRTLVFDRRIFPVLRSMCSWRVTTMWVNRPAVAYVGQVSLPFGVDKWVVGCNRCPQPDWGGAIWWRLTRWRQALVKLQVKLCDTCLSALSVRYSGTTKRTLYKYTYLYIFTWKSGRDVAH